MLKQFLENIIKQIVDNPDQVKITEVNGETVCIYEVELGHGDHGKVIGKHGQNAHSIRTLLGAVAAKNNKRTILEIID
jgi:predicted RNA-binding protein YlqC (UPF0109 family)